MTDFLDDLMNNDATPQGMNMRYDFFTTFPSMRETLDKNEHGYRDYANDLKDHTHEQLVELIKQMDISAQDTAKQIIHMRKVIDGLGRRIQVKDEIIESLESKQSRIRSAIKFLIEFANEDVIDDDSMEKVTMDEG